MPGIEIENTEQHIKLLFLAAANKSGQVDQKFFNGECILFLRIEGMEEVVMNNRIWEICESREQSRKVLSLERFCIVSIFLELCGDAIYLLCINCSL